MFELLDGLTVTEVETLQSSARAQLGRELDLNSVREFVQSQPNTCWAFNKQLMTKDLCDREAAVAWVDTGYVKDGEYYYISLTRVSSSSLGEFNGFYFGTAEFLLTAHADHFNLSSNKLAIRVSKIKAMLEKSRVPRSVKFIWSNEQTLKVEELGKVKEEVREEVKKEEKEEKDEEEDYRKILKEEFQERGFEAIVDPLWEALGVNPFSSKLSLGRFLGTVAARIAQLLKRWDKKEELSWGVVSEDGYHVVANVGLFDKFGSPILLVYEWCGTCWFSLMQVNSMKNLFGLGFEAEKLKRDFEPISFFDEEIPLSTNLNDYDFNYNALSHIICDRRDRFPEETKSWSEEDLAMRIKEQLKQGLKFCRVNPNYAKRVYSTSEGGCVWYLPFRLTASVNEKPELVMVVRRDEFYCVVTVLPYSNRAQHRIEAANLYSGIW